MLINMCVCSHYNFTNSDMFEFMCLQAQKRNQVLSFKYANICCTSIKTNNL